MLLSTVLDAEWFRPELFATNGWASRVGERVDELLRAHVWITNGTMRTALTQEIKKNVADETIDKDIRIQLAELSKRLSNVCCYDGKITGADRNKSIDHVTCELPKITEDALDLLRRNTRIDLMFTAPECRQKICSSEPIIAEKVHDFDTYYFSEAYKVEKNSREMVNLANKQPEAARELLRRFIQWSPDVVLIDRYIAEVAWYNRPNWINFNRVIKMLFDMWKNRAAKSESDEGQFRIVSVLPGESKKKEKVDRIFPFDPLDVRKALQSKLKNDAIEVEIRAVPRRLNHDRYLVIHDGRFVVSNSKGFDFRFNGKGPCEFGFRRMREGGVVDEVLRSDLLTPRLVASTPRPKP